MTEKPQEAAITSQGVFSTDPARDLPLGSAIRFRPVEVAHTFNAPAVWLERWETFEGMLLALQFVRADAHEVTGSAVMVAPGVALCATHVFRGYLEDIERGTVAPYAHGIGSAGLQIWRVSDITLVPHSDLTILGLTYQSALPPKNEFTRATITTRLPPIGDPIFIAGFRAADSSFPREEEGLGRVFANLLVCSGLVTERFEGGRDRAMLPWPTLEVDCPAWGGLSGGPAFDKHGRVVGLLSSSYTGPEDTTGPSYISLVWPGLCAEITGGWPSGIIPAHSSLLQLDARLCLIDDPSAINVESSDQGKAVRITYKGWE